MVRSIGVRGDFGKPTMAIPFDAADRSAPASNTAAVVTLAADATSVNILEGIDCSYSGTPSAGSFIRVEDGSGNTVWQLTLGAAGPYSFRFDPPRAGSNNTALIVTLSAGGVGVSGVLNVNARRDL